MSQPFLGIMNVIVTNGRVGSDSVIPDRHRTIVPLHAYLEVGGMVDVLPSSQREHHRLPTSRRTYIEQQLQQRSRLLILQSNNLLREAGVDEQRLLSRHRMHTHDRMVRLHWLAADELAIPSCALRLWVAVVFGCQALQQLLDRLGETLVSCDLAHPSRITAGGWDRQ